MEFTSLWAEASSETERENTQRTLTAARIRAIPTWQFLALARTQTEFEHRLALADDRLRETVGDADLPDVVASLRQDFTALLESRTADQDGPTCPNCGGSGASMGMIGRVMHYRCRNCGSNYSINMAGQVQAVRHLAVVMQTVAGENPFASQDDEDTDGDGDSDEGDGESDKAFYVIDEHSGKDLGGPYPDADAAQAAIDAGDFDGDQDDLAVEKGDEDGAPDDDADDEPSEMPMDDGDGAGRPF